MVAKENAEAYGAWVIISGANNGKAEVEDALDERRRRQH
jgi:hypothetical protein